MSETQAAPGTVYLVGAGPGNPELLTVRARRLLDSADVVMHDSLVHDDLLGSVPESTRLVDVGKRPENGERTTQEEIHDLLVEAANEPASVVRLKCGDPTVFARGGEEAEALAEAGVDCEIVPGVTSAIAAPGVAGIPVTHREHASALTVVTGHEDPTKPESALDWEALAETVAAGGTLSILMGVGKLPENMAALRAAGLDPETPVAMIERATYEDETVVTGTVGTIVDRAERADISPPAVTLVGDVVEVREAIDACVQSLGRQLVTTGQYSQIEGD
ncbi:uroporphyrinogen-III C-methyltransferase [Halovenus sp. WSH3]|uniref:uroporphyrinogen-III C-methyltransferase n=1 Tax=Halovenus carboxidivorans TaxID=2692199 RepID=A0A6B0T0L8_9EURY|nr:uroporphyrinogen-III C-methyltransferase [Halovenus carboxidivorans]MXR51574.1 uroporphyrinogen-III C-methyltransferase [Halovenus carboxidivorans]